MRRGPSHAPAVSIVELSACRLVFEASEVPGAFNSDISLQLPVLPLSRFCGSGYALSGWTGGSEIHAVGSLSARQIVLA